MNYWHPLTINCISYTGISWQRMNQKSFFKFFFTKIAVAGVGSFSTLSAGRGSAGPLGRHLTGLRNRRHQVLVVRVPPAPPADLGLTAPGDHGPVPLVPAGHISTSARLGKQTGEKRRSAVGGRTCRPPRGSSSRTGRTPRSPAPCR